MGLTDLVVDARVEQDALGGGCLAGIDVGHDADVADLVQVGEHVLCHVGSSGSCWLMVEQVELQANGLAGRARRHPARLRQLDSASDYQR